MLPKIVGLKHKVALEPILFTSNFWRGKNWQKFPSFGGARIGPTCLSQNFAD